MGPWNDRFKFCSVQATADIPEMCYLKSLAVLCWVIRNAAPAFKTPASIFALTTSTCGYRRAESCILYPARREDDLAAASSGFVCKGPASVLSAESRPAGTLDHPRLRVCGLASHSGPSILTATLPGGPQGWCTIHTASQLTMDRQPLNSSSLEPVFSGKTQDILTGLRTHTPTGHSLEASSPPARSFCPTIRAKRLPANARYLIKEFRQ